MSLNNTPHSPQGAGPAPQERPRSVRETAIKLLADLDAWERHEPGILGYSAMGLRPALKPSADALRLALQQPEFSRADLLSDAPWAVEGIEIMRAGKEGLLPIHIKAIVNAAEAGLQAHGSFQLRWDADMRAIERWQRGDLFSERTRALLERALAELEKAKEVHAERISGDDYRECSAVAEELEGRLKIGEPGQRNHVWPDHADLVVWLLELLDAQPASPTGAEIKGVVRSLGELVDCGCTEGDLAEAANGAISLIDRMQAVLWASERRCLQAEVRGVKAGRLLVEAAQLFRSYEAHHRAKFPLWTPGSTGEGAESHDKAERNAEIAARIEALLPSLDVPPDAIGESLLGGPQGAKLDSDGLCPICGRDYAGGEETHCTASDDCPSFFEELGKAHPDHPGGEERTHGPESAVDD
jgi:hypothetical protein